MKVAVTGAAGYLGLNIIGALLDEGHDVLAIDRVAGSPPAGSHGSGRLSWQTADMLDEEAMVRALDGVEVVHHLVAVISLRRVDPIAWRVNTEGVATVARAALRVGARRMVNCGSLASFHYTKNATVNEESQRSTSDRALVYHRSKYFGEVELLKIVDAGLDALTCNPTGVFGPADHPTRLSRMNQGLLDASLGKVPVGVSGEFDMVDVRDVAQGFLLAAEKGRTGHNYLLGGHRHGLTRSMQVAAEMAGARGPRFMLPVRLLQTVAPLVDPFTRRLGSESFAPAAMENISLAPIVDRTKARLELGYEPRPTEESLRDLVDFFGTAGLLSTT